MKRSAQILLHLGVLLSLIVSEGFLLLVGCSVKNLDVLQIRWLPWLLLTCIFYLFGEWLSGRTLPVNLLLALHTLMILGSGIAGLFLIRISPDSMGTYFAGILALAIPVAIGSYFVFFPESLRALVLGMDFLVIFFLLYLFMDLVGVLLPQAGFERIFFLSMGAVLTILVLVRTSSDMEGSGVSIRSLLPILAFIGAALVLAAGAALLIFGQVKSVTDLFVLIIKTLVLGFFWIMGKLSDLLSLFFTWLLNLLPDPEPGSLDMEPVAAGLGEMEMETESIALPPALLIGILAVLLLVVLIFLFRRFRGRTWRKESSRKKYGSVQKIRPSSHFLADFLRNAFRALYFRFLLFRKRKTSSARAYRLEKYGQKHGMPRRSSESTPAYLRRLASCPSLFPDEKTAGSVLELAACLELEYYG